MVLASTISTRREASLLTPGQFSGCPCSPPPRAPSFPLEQGLTVLPGGPRTSRMLTGGTRTLRDPSLASQVGSFVAVTLGVFPLRAPSTLCTASSCSLSGDPGLTSQARRQARRAGHRLRQPVRGAPAAPAVPCGDCCARPAPGPHRSPTRLLKTPSPWSRFSAGARPGRPPPLAAASLPSASQLECPSFPGLHAPTTLAFSPSAFSPSNSLLNPHQPAPHFPGTSVPRSLMGPVVPGSGASGRGSPPPLRTGGCVPPVASGSASPLPSGLLGSRLGPPGAPSSCLLKGGAPGPLPVLSP